MERRLKLLATLVRAEEKIRGEYSTSNARQEGIEEIYEVLALLEPRFKLSPAYNQAYEELKHLENRDISPREFSISNILREIIKYTD